MGSSWLKVARNARVSVSKVFNSPTDIQSKSQEVLLASTNHKHISTMSCLSWNKCVIHLSVRPLNSRDGHLPAVLCAPLCCYFVASVCFQQMSSRGLKVRQDNYSREDTTAIRMQRKQSSQAHDVHLCNKTKQRGDGLSMRCMNGFRLPERL